MQDAGWRTGTAPARRQRERSRGAPRPLFGPRDPISQPPAKSQHAKSQHAKSQQTSIYSGLIDSGLVGSTICEGCRESRRCARESYGTPPKEVPRVEPTNSEFITVGYVNISITHIDVPPNKNMHSVFIPQNVFIN